jgi:hypothetical protein
MDVTVRSEQSTAYECVMRDEFRSPLSNEAVRHSVSEEIELETSKSEGSTSFAVQAAERCAVRMCLWGSWLDSCQHVHL